MLITTFCLDLYREWYCNYYIRESCDNHIKMLLGRFAPNEKFESFEELYWYVYYQKNSSLKNSCVKEFYT